MDIGPDHSETIDYRIATGVLEAIARGAVSGDPRVRLHQGAGRGRNRGVGVEAAVDSCRVSLTLEARMGESLPSLGAWAQEQVVRTVGEVTGLRVDSVEVVFSAVFLPDER